MRLKKVRAEKVFRNEDYLPKETSGEAKICLECPLPKCIEWNCKRLKEYKAKIKAERKNGKKSN